jgi:plastocyanin
MRSGQLLLILLLVPVVSAGCGIFYFTEARNEQVADSNNNNLMLSMQAPDDWNSGKLSTTVLSVDWKLNGLFATNFGTKLFGLSNVPIAFFTVVNAPSIVNTALPFLQKTGLISFALGQAVTINKETDLKLSDGSSAHQYSISASLEQEVPLDKAMDAVIITTQQNDKTYIIAYGTEQGQLGQFQSSFDSMLRSVTIGSASFSSTASSSKSTAPPQIPPSIQPTVPESPSEESFPMTGGNMSMIGDNSTAGGASVSIASGSSLPDGKGFIPDTMPVKIGTLVTWINEDDALHTVTSGTPKGGNSGAEFDSSYVDAGKTWQYRFDKMGTFKYYCTLHPFMKGKIVVS